MKLKKLLSLALALSMALSLAACGNGGSGTASTPASSGSGSDASTSQSAGEVKGLTPEERSKEFITVGTGPTSGIYFPIGGAFATALKDYGYQTSAEATNATGQNIQNILNGDAEIAIAMQDAVMQAYTGTGAYEGKGEASDLRALMRLWPNYVQLVTVKGTGINSVADLKGKRVGVGAANSGVEINARMILNAYGITYDDITPDYLAYGEAIDNMKNGFGLPVVVAINAFPTDTAEEQAYVEQVCAEQGVPCVLSEVFAKGGEGGKALAEKVLDIMEDRPIQYTYPLEMPLKDKINAIATKIYRADGVNYSAAASKTLAELTELGYGNLPVCIAKTQYSFSDNAKLTGAPTGFTMEVREVRLAAGAGFVVVICGSIMTMPGLPKKPAAVSIDVDADGKITGLF